MQTPRYTTTPRGLYTGDMNTEQAPTNRLDPRVKTAWRLRSTLGWTPVLLGSLLFLGFAPVIGMSAWPGVIALVVVVALFAMAVTIVPEIRYRRWRWEVRDEEIRLQTGLIIRELTVIPMVRVQHVDTAQGPIMRALDLSDVHIFTAAGKHAIPALKEADAASLRDRIAVLARVTDDGGL